ncbi:MAG: TlyA family RNA methyltransferase [Candidatus Rokubacteria bacterium]|nr:TlyA family RNA methyltransferase [Candidatus Rokubacteria bacterium]
MPLKRASSASDAAASGPLNALRSKGARVRLDQLLVERNLAGTRAEAARLILADRVRLGGQRADKAGQLCRADAAVNLVTVSPYVGRGGEKLAAALDAFGITPRGRVCLDVGASTGGFTDCLLQRGARRVYAVDVGHGQLHPRIRSDARVTVLDGLNARNLDASRLDQPVTLATIDVSFISLEKVLLPVAASLAADAPSDIVALVKPQFEVGRGRVGKGGVVRDSRRHGEVLLRLAAFASAHGLAPRGVVASPLRGAKGNREFFLHLGCGSGAAPVAALEAAVDAAVHAAERASPRPPTRAAAAPRGSGADEIR